MTLAIPTSPNQELLDQQTRLLTRQPAPQVLDLSVATQNLGLIGPMDQKALTGKSVDPKLDAEADRFVNQLMQLNTSNPQNMDLGEVSVENLGSNIAASVSSKSALLQAPLKRFGQFGGAEGQGIADTLTELKVQFDDIDPARFDFSSGWGGRVLSLLPFVGKPLNRYFTRFESAGKVIESLFDSLETSKEQLARDIETLRADQVTMRTATKQLQDLITVALLIDKKLEEKIDLLDPTSDEVKYIKTKLQFRLKQRITDLQQQLVVNQQGVLMFEVLLDNNKELIRGVKRCKDVTYLALMIGITAAQALANQRIVLNKLGALDEVGDRMIRQNAQLLKGQAIEINKKAASAQLSDQGLAEAMTVAIQALDDVERFRLEALTQMSEAISQRSRLSAQGEKAIEKIERGNQAVIALDIDSVA